MTIGSFFTIGNCISNLPTKFGNRQDLASLADGSRGITALMEAIKELTETYEFEELKYQTPVPSLTPLNMTAGNPLIPIATLLGTIPSNSVLYPQFQGQNIIDITDVYTFWMWFAGGVNQAGRTLKYRRIPTIDTYAYGITNNNFSQLGTAPPVYASRFGNNLQVGPVPDKNYQYFVRMKLRHPFPIGGTAAFVPATMHSSLSGGGIVTGLFVDNAGSGYLPNTTGNLTIAPSPTGDNAVATFGVGAGGSLNGVFVITHGGSGYVTAPTVNTAATASQQIFMPDSWQEIVELCAGQRIALWEGASEYISMFEGLLKTKGIDIAEARSRRAQMVRDEKHNERSMSLMTNPYTWA
jgi:hypothetical protein